jgi:hypothetical protein
MTTTSPALLAQGYTANEIARAARRGEPPLGRRAARPAGVDRAFRRAASVVAP